MVQSRPVAGGARPPARCGGRSSRSRARAPLAHAPLTHERIVRWHGAVRAQAHHFSVVRGKVLGLVALAALAEGDEQAPVARECQARAEVEATKADGLLAKDGLHDVELSALAVERELRTGHGGGAAAGPARLRIREVDELRGREIGRDGHVEKPALAHDPDGRHVAQWRRQPAVLADEAHAPGPLGHQQPAVRQDGERPRVHQTLGISLHLDDLLGRPRRRPGLLGGGVRGEGDESRKGDDKSCLHRLLLRSRHASAA